MRRLCNDSTLADDLAQQVFLSAWQSISKLNNPNHFGSWLKTIAVNTWKQHFRRFQKEYELNKQAVEQHESTSKNNVNTTYQQFSTHTIDLDKHLQILPHNARLCVTLAFEWGMSHQEISAHTDIPLGTVKSHIKRSMDSLKSAFSNTKINLSEA